MINGARKIISELNKNGFSGYMVGGCVRDSLMGITPLDYDITTDALPEDIISIFDKTYLTGKKHGTVTVLSSGYHYEVTTFRIDGKYINNRKPESVTFTKSLKEDLRRRDFTVNALAFNDTEGYIDYFDGAKDIENKILRTVSDPYERLTEDALRILRGIRFSVKLGFTLEEETFKAMKKLSYLIKNISVERITSELSKMFEINPYLSVKLLNEINFFNIFNLKITEEKLRMVEKLKKSNFINTVTLLIYDSPEYLDFLNKMKLSNSDKDKIKKLINGIHYEFTDKISLKKFMADYSISDIFYDMTDIIEITGKDAQFLTGFYKEILSNNECYNLKNLKIDGNDLIKLGYENKYIGTILKELLSKVIKDNNLNEYNKLVNITKQMNL